MKHFKLLALFFLTLFFQNTFARTYVFVHGAMIDATAFYKIVTPLENAGNKVIVINLPSHGTDNTAIVDVSYAKYVSTICDAIKLQNEKVILIGHSMAGLLISSVAEKMPEKIEYLVYLGAFIPQNNDNVFKLNGNDKESKFGTNLKVAEDKSSAIVKPEMIKTVFCNDCSNQDITYLKLSQKPEALAPLAEEIKLTDKGFNSVPKIIIQTQLDNAITFNFQKEMQKTAKNTFKVYTIQSSHLPFISKPNELVKILLSIK